MTREERNNTILINAIRLELRELEKLESIAGEAEDEYTIFPEDTEAESAFDLAYTNEFKQYIKVSEMLAAFLDIDGRTARKMVHGRRTDLEKILTA